MRYCTSCGAELGVGRFCTNCGARVDAAAGDPTATAERPAVADPTATVERPAVRGYGGSDGPRYPLYADELPVAAATVGHRAQRAPAVAWVALLVVGMLLAAFLGGWLALRDGGSAEASTGTDTPGGQASATGGDPAGEDPAGGDPAGRGPADAGPLEELGPTATIDAPPQGRDSTDLTTGRKVTYSPAHMVDGDDTTAYRVERDAAGTLTITFAFDEERTVSSVGLINGYAKSSADPKGGTVDWYPRQFRITAVEWSFDSGEAIRQQLQLVEDLQVMTLTGGVETRTVTLRVLETVPPEALPRARRVTSISEVSLRGS